MSYIPREVTDAIIGTYEAWLPFAAALHADDAPAVEDADEPTPADVAIAAALEGIEALQARIEHYRANPVFPAEGA